MKVKELIDLLKEYNPELTVMLASDEFGEVELEIQGIWQNSLDGGPLIG